MNIPTYPAHDGVRRVQPMESLRAHQQQSSASSSLSVSIFPLQKRKPFDTTIGVFEDCYITMLLYSSCIYDIVIVKTIHSLKQIIPIMKTKFVYFIPHHTFCPDKISHNIIQKIMVVFLYAIQENVIIFVIILWPLCRLVAIFAQISRLQRSLRLFANDDHTLQEFWSLIL